MLFLFAPVASVFLYFQFEKATIRREIKRKMIAGMDRDELVLLKFSKKDTLEKLRWEHSKEFEYNGQMYDVVARQIKGDSIYYHCWWDHEETELNQKLGKLVALAWGKNTEHHKAQLALVRFYSSFFCSPLFQWECTSYKPAETVFHSGLYRDIFSNVSLIPPTPPPKMG